MATYYLAPNGADTNSGTITSPFKTLVKAWSVITAGDTIYLRGGVYSFAQMQYLQSRNGTAGNLIKVWAYPGETPILKRGYSYDANNIDLVYMEGNYFHWKGIEFADNKQEANGAGWSSFRAGFTNNSIFENIHYHHNGAGFSIRGASSNNLVLNSDFHHNQDPYSAEPYDGADGLALNFCTGTNNTVRGCRFWWNADDGLDLWANEGNVLVENCWSFYNGYIVDSFNPAGNGCGFKLGLTNNSSTSVKRTVRNCISYKNRNWGFCENQALVNMILYNNTGADNGTLNYWFGSWGASPKTFKNNISLNGGTLWGNVGYLIGDDAIHDHNSWNGVGASNSDFISVDPSQLLLPRKSDGSLPDITFLAPKSTSWLVNSGVNVGLPYSGSAPDLGAIEYVGGTVTPPPTPPVNILPVVNAGVDQTITLPTNSVSLNGVATDSDGLIVNYAWKYVSGPTQYSVVSPTTAQTNINNLVEGTYVFSISATDNSGATVSDSVSIVVKPAVVVPTKTIKTANNNLSTKKLVVTFTDNSSVTINNTTKPIKTVTTDYTTKRVLVTYTDNTTLVI